MKAELSDALPSVVWRVVVLRADGERCVYERSTEADALSCQESWMTMPGVVRAEMFMGTPTWECVDRYTVLES